MSYRTVVSSLSISIVSNVSDRIVLTSYVLHCQVIYRVSFRTASDGINHTE